MNKYSVTPFDPSNHTYDIIFIIGEPFFDHPLCGPAILKRLLEKHNFKVAIIDEPKDPKDIKKYGEPNLFFAVSSGSIDSMLRNFTPLKKLRSEDENQKYKSYVSKRAVIQYCNWIKQNFKSTPIVIGGIEASLRRFAHYDYWDNNLRKPILFDSRADILCYGSSEKQILEIANKLKRSKSEDRNTDIQNIIKNIQGTCILSNDLPADFQEIPSFLAIKDSKKKFCDMQNSFSINKNLAQECNNKYVLQYKSPKYTTQDLDEYYSFPFERTVPKELRGFEFSVVTHRGCIGGCNFCSINLTQGNKIISRSEKSILEEIKNITKLKHFKGNIDDLGGPSANMYGMDCNLCDGNCIDCTKLDRSNKRYMSLLKKARRIPGVKNIFIRSGVRFDLLNETAIREIAQHHIASTLQVAPEHVNKNVLELMNKNRGDLDKFIKIFSKYKTKKALSFYFLVAHPGSSMKENEELKHYIKNLDHAERVQVFTPTPMTVSTCMYWTGLNPKNKKPVYIPYSYSEKKKQKGMLVDCSNSNNGKPRNDKTKKKY